jgi:thiol:disulfide interchange protein DsbD
VLRIALLFALALPAACAARARRRRRRAVTPAVVKTDQVRAELLAHAPEGVAAGKPLWLGLRIEHAAALAHLLEEPRRLGAGRLRWSWKLPAGFVRRARSSGPRRRQLPVGPLMNFGYEGTLLLPVPVHGARGLRGQALDVRLQAEWLVCKDVCIPESGEFALKLPAQAATAVHACALRGARARRSRLPWTPAAGHRRR